MTVILDIGFKAGKQALTIIIGGLVDILHIGVVQLEDTKAHIKVPGRQRTFRFNLFTGTADAFLTDFADVLVPSFVSFALFIALFWQLHHDKFTVSIIFSVELHHSMGSGGGTGEEIKDNRIFIARKPKNFINKFCWLWSTKLGRC